MLGEPWHLESGSVAVGCAQLTMPTSETTCVVTSHTSDAYVAEVYVKAIRSDRGARFGFVPAWQDSSHFTEVVVDAASSQMSVYRWTAGIGKVVASAPLGEIDPSLWQRLSITRSLTEVSVAIGDSPPLEFSVPVAAASVGLRAHRTDTRWSAFALTDHLSLYGERLDLIGRRFASSTPVAASATGLGLGRGRTFELVGPRPTHASTVHDFVLPTDCSVVVATPWMTDAGDEITIRLTRREYRIQVRRGADIVANVTVNHDKEVTATSLRTVVLGERAVVHVNGSPHCFTVRPAPRPRQRIELHGAQFESYEETTITDPPHHIYIEE